MHLRDDHDPGRARHGIDGVTADVTGEAAAARPTSTR